MKFIKSSLPIIIISLSLIASGCSKISIQDKELIENINAKYYSVASQDVNKIVFGYTSNKFINLIESIQTQEVRTLMSKINFIVSWRPYGRIVIDIVNEPKFNKSDANAGLRQMMGGMKKEITGLFLMLSPMMNRLIDDSNLKSFQAINKDGHIVLELSYFNNMSIKYIFDKPTYLLLKTEINKGKKLVSSSEYKFDTYKNQYLFKSMNTDFIANKILKTNITINYKNYNNILLPQEVDIKAKTTNASTSDKISLAPMEAS